MAASVSGASSANAHAEFVGDVGAQRAFGARVVHRRDAPTGPCAPPPGREQFEGVGELGQIGDAHRAGGGAERLPRRVLAGQCARVRGHHRAPARRAADGEDDDRHVLFGGAAQRRPQPRDRPRRLQQQADDAGVGVVERIVDVVGGVGDQLLSGRDRQPEAEATSARRNSVENADPEWVISADTAVRQADRAPDSPAPAPRGRC